MLGARRPSTRRSRRSAPARTAGTLIPRRRTHPVRGEGTIPPAGSASRQDGPRPAGADTGPERGSPMPALPPRPSLQHLRKQAKALRREHDVPLHRAQHELARSYGFASWPRLVRYVEATGLEGIERALVLADPVALAPLLTGDPAAATAPVADLPPLLA